MSTKYPLATTSWDAAEYDAIQRVIEFVRSIPQIPIWLAIAAA